jgi:hypothetical protein
MSLASQLGYAYMGEGVCLNLAACGKAWVCLEGEQLMVDRMTLSKLLSMCCNSDR